MQVAQAGIYIYFFRDTGLNACEQSYIGSTTNFEKRHREHMNQLRRNKHINNKFQHAYNKYGDKHMVYEILEEAHFPKDYDKVLKKEYLEGREQMHYNELKSSYNYVIPGTWKQSEGRKKESSTLFITRKRPVFLVDKDLKILKKFSGLREAARELNTEVSSISKVASLKYESTKGLLFRFEDTLGKLFIKVTKPSIQLNVPRFYNRIPVKCYNLEGEYVSTYDSILLAAQALEIQESGIKRCCSGEMAYTGKWIFRFSNSVLPVNKVIPKNIKPILCFIDGIFYKEYSNMNKAEKDLGIGRGAIHKGCALNRVYKQKYLFTYKNQ